MSGYSDLGTIGQQKISEQSYKQLFGYPGGKYLQPFSAEIPGTSRINVFQNQLFSQEIPSTAPTDLIDASFNLISNTYISSIPTISKKQKSTAKPYIVKYSDVVLSSVDLTKNQIYWFAGANNEFNTSRPNQLVNNLLTKGIPPNYDPSGSYAATIYINDVAYNIGNAQYPWVYNPNSGIIQFLGNTEYVSGNPLNNYPNANQIVRFTFWRYEGTIGNDVIALTTLSASGITGATGFIGGVTFSGGNITASGSITAKGATFGSGSTYVNIIDGNITADGRITANGNIYTTNSWSVEAGAFRSTNNGGVNHMGGVTLTNFAVIARNITGTTGATFGSDAKYVSITNGAITASGTISASGITGATGFIGGVTLSGGAIVGNLTGTATKVNINNDTLDSETYHYPVFVTGIGSQEARIDNGQIPLSYKPVTGELNMGIMNASVVNQEGTITGTIIQTTTTSGVFRGLRVIPNSTGGWNGIAQEKDTFIFAQAGKNGEETPLEHALSLSIWSDTNMGLRISSSSVYLGWSDKSLTFSQAGTIFTSPHIAVKGITGNASEVIPISGSIEVSGTGRFGNQTQNVTFSGGAVTTTGGGSNYIGGVTLNNGAITATGKNHNIGGVTFNDRAISNVTSITASGTITSGTITATGTNPTATDAIAPFSAGNFKEDGTKNLIIIAPAAFTDNNYNKITQKGDALILANRDVTTNGHVSLVLTTHANTTSGIRIGSTGLQLGWGGTSNEPTNALTFSQAGIVFNNDVTVNKDINVNKEFTVNAGAFRTTAVNDYDSAISGVSFRNGNITASGTGSSIGGVTLSGGAITASGSISGLSTISATGAITTSGTGSSIGGVTLSGGAITASGSISGLSTITASGAITATGANHNIGGVTFNTRAITNVTSITASGQIEANSFNALSDYRIKKNVEPIVLNEYNLDNLKPVVYTLNSSGQKCIGFIAHEIQEHYPFLVTGTKDGPETQSVNYIGLIGVLTKEVQELKQENVNLKQRLEKIESTIGL
jgi:hypothetical protein